MVTRMSRSRCSCSRSASPSSCASRRPDGCDRRDELLIRSIPRVSAPLRPMKRSPSVREGVLIVYRSSTSLAIPTYSSKSPSIESRPRSAICSIGSRCPHLERVNEAGAPACRSRPPSRDQVGEYPLAAPRPTVREECRGECRDGFGLLCPGCSLDDPPVESPRTGVLQSQALRVSPIQGIPLPFCVRGLSVSSSSDPIVGQDHLPGAGNYWVAIGVPATSCQPNRHPTPDGNERIRKCCRRLSGPTPIQARSHRTESARGSLLAQLMVRGARRGGPAFRGGPVGRLTVESG